MPKERHAWKESNERLHIWSVYFDYIYRVMADGMAKLTPARCLLDCTRLETAKNAGTDLVFVVP